MRQNIDAIKLALRLDKENRTATQEEREILSAYSGFGGIKAILNPAFALENEKITGLLRAVALAMTHITNTLRYCGGNSPKQSGLMFYFF